MRRGEDGEWRKVVCVRVLGGVWVGRGKIRVDLWGVHDKANTTPSVEILLRLSSAFIEIQHYKDACEILEDVAAEYPNHFQMDKIAANIKFCKNPCPGVKTLKNFNESWLHNFVLVRLGNRRFNFLSDDDLLEVNSLIRANM